MHKKLERLLQSGVAGEHFAPVMINLDDDDCELWVQVRESPARFSSRMFSGSWAYPHRHPAAGPMRVLVRIEGIDGIRRLISRQGRYLYAYPLS